MKYLFTNVLGSFIFDENLNKIEEFLFKDIEEYLNKDKVEDQIKTKNPKIVNLPKEKLNQVLEFFKKEDYFNGFYQKNIQLTKQGIKKSVGGDWLIIQTIANIDELDKNTNVLIKRLREWYSLYLPEFENKMTHQERFVELILEKSKEELMRENDIDPKTCMGADLEDIHVQEIKALAQQIQGLQELRHKHEQYLELVMKTHCPNLLELAGITIGAKLIELGKGLRHLAMLPASTIQLLGAEKALFRHIKTGSKSPKFGVLYQHPLIQKARKKEQGKTARVLADKLSLCARLDYFKGEFKAKEYRKEIEEKFLR